ncbi:MAG: hypothetical protein CMM52_03645 [Rhodospirillaceae bacterium]|nr:hypothetical protein [Rhodospirillaceae bacterium]|tara:strand:+ start:1276 stop:1467 length:192 start_codon:yes stop_codon:yes gene_type:complete
MDWDATILGAVFGVGCVFIWRGITVLRNQNIDDANRRKGFWPLNIGLLLAAISMFLIAQSKGG